MTADEFEPVRAEVLRKGDTVRRTRKSRAYTITEVETIETRMGMRRWVASADVQLTSELTALWWRKVK